MNFKQLLQLFTDGLTPLYGVDEAAAIFGVAARHVSGLDRVALLIRKAEQVSLADLTVYEDILAELKTGRPLQYVLGEIVFYGLPFKVNPAVLIPRPETEELVEWVLDSAQSLVDSFPLRILDIGTGSGCIAVSVKKNLADAEVFALDVSAGALETAAANAGLNGTLVNFLHADIRDFSIKECFDVIVSNPPYIKMDEKAAMHDNVLAHEPHLALFVGNEDPLVFYRAIAVFARSSLKRGGLLFFEINEHLGKETLQLLKDNLFTDIELRKDIQGKDRMVRCRLI